MPFLRYNASEGIIAHANEATRDEVVRQALQRYMARNVQLTEESLYCCRILVSNKLSGDMTDAKLAVVILRQEQGEPAVDLLLWTEAEERGIAKYLLSLINQGDGSYRAEIGRRLYPEKTPEGTPPDEIH